MLTVGTVAPDFSLLDQNGVAHTLSEYRGKTLVLYFYPKDSTSGCTKQACEFSRLAQEYAQKGAVIVGVSKDSVASHKKFETKNELSFTLRSDPELTTLQAYDVGKEKKCAGKVSMGTLRTTYVIDPEGVVARAYDKVKAAENPAQVLADL